MTSSRLTGSTGRQFVGRPSTLLPSRPIEDAMGGIVSEPLHGFGRHLQLGSHQEEPAGASGLEPLTGRSMFRIVQPGR